MAQCITVIPETIITNAFGTIVYSFVRCECAFLSSNFTEN